MGWVWNGGDARIVLKRRKGCVLSFFWGNELCLCLFVFCWGSDEDNEQCLIGHQKIHCGRGVARRGMQPRLSRRSKYSNSMIKKNLYLG